MWHVNECMLDRAAQDEFSLSKLGVTAEIHLKTHTITVNQYKTSAMTISGYKAIVRQDTYILFYFFFHNMLEVQISDKIGYTA